MKKLVVPLIITIYAISFMEFHGLAKLPTLIQHYLEYTQYNDITFLKFLSIQYQNPNHDHQSESPIKECWHCLAVHSIALPGSKLELQSKQCFCTQKLHACFYNKSIPASHLSEIWQPPRI